MSRMTDRAVTLLPQPDSPTTPSVCPRLISKLTPSTALTDAVDGVEVRPQPVDLQDHVRLGAGSRGLAAAVRSASS